MPPKKKKRITPTLVGPVGSTTKKGKKQLLPGKKRLKQRAKPKSKPKTKTKTQTKDDLAVKVLMQMCKKLNTACKVCKKLQSAGGTKHKKNKKAKSRGGGTAGQKTTAKKLKKLSKHYGKLTEDANPKLAF